MKTIIIVMAMAMALVPGIATAATWDNWTGNDIILSGTTGTGSNASYLVVNFDSASYAYKYLWNTSTESAPSGFDLLNALSTGVPGFSFAYHTDSKWPELGAMIDTISCGGHTGTGGWPGAWWNYWTGQAGGPIESAWEGCSSSPLADGSVDAWVFSTDWMQGPKIPGVPEPSSIVTLCSLIGLAGLACRRKKQD